MIITCDVGFKLRKFSYISILLRVFVMSGCWILANAFLASVDDHMIFLLPTYMVNFIHWFFSHIKPFFHFSDFSGFSLIFAFMFMSDTGFFLCFFVFVVSSPTFEIRVIVITSSNEWGHVTFSVFGRVYIGFVLFLFKCLLEFTIWAWDFLVGRMLVYFKFSFSLFQGIHPLTGCYFCLG